MVVGVFSSCRIPFLPDRYEEVSPEDTFSNENEYNPVESFLGAVERGDEELVKRGLHPNSPRRSHTLAAIQADFPADRVYRVYRREVRRYPDLDAFYDDTVPEEVFYFDIRTETYGDWTTFEVARVYDWSTEEP